MTFTEEIVEFLHDILYSDGVPVPYKQQAHLLLDKFKESEERALGKLDAGSVTIYTNVFPKPITLSKQIVDEICASIPTQKIMAIKVLRGVLKDNGEMVTAADIANSAVNPIPYSGLKQAKDVIDGWDGWKKIHH